MMNNFKEKSGEVSVKENESKGGREQIRRKKEKISASMSDKQATNISNNNISTDKNTD